jgi:hypothetical protein
MYVQSFIRVRYCWTTTIYIFHQRRIKSRKSPRQASLWRPSSAYRLKNIKKKYSGASKHVPSLPIWRIRLCFSPYCLQITYTCKYIFDASCEKITNQLYLRYWLITIRAENLNNESIRASIPLLPHWNDSTRPFPTWVFTINTTFTEIYSWQ